eukprot:TRINITY_DN4843_c0_g1_i1.p1 TRINITY_DN4843_c0_g1~~TRINITY_DN4843_c0_g1_i1.p1  ORF type:complete len:586 (-),score=162.72 TRINITY_DN4843_c0_g1_i1:36-1667(-)
MARKERGEGEGSDAVVYKIDVPANRYDILCLEGLSSALRVFLKKMDPPVFRRVDGRSKIVMTVKAETKAIRPFVVCAVLRNITFDAVSYASFIDLQDKLHQNICRRRTLVAIGTHDLDTISGPFTYEALPPRDIRFKPLNQKKEMDGAELMTFYETDNKLKKFLDIIRAAPRYPVIYDSKRRVLSLPPIINGDHSKITLNTKNVLIECTATDFTKANIVLNTIIAMFSPYCNPPNQCETVDVVYEETGRRDTLPDLSEREITTSVDYINKGIGISITGDAIVDLLNRMQLRSRTDGHTITVGIPPTRSDILHACDLMEDVAIAYGYNNIVKRIPTTMTHGKQLPINKLSDLLRNEIAQAGYIEVFNFVLCSIAENFALLRQEDNGLAVQLANPKTQEFQVVRCSLLPGVLKTLSHNKETPLPHRVFELSDVVVKTTENDVGAKNLRMLTVAYSGHTSGFEFVHGILDRLMLLLRIPPATPANRARGYYLQPCANPTYFQGRCADVICNGARVGVLGIVHPQVLKNFELANATSALELSVDAFL